VRFTNAVDHGAHRLKRRPASEDISMVRILQLGEIVHPRFALDLVFVRSDSPELAIFLYVAVPHVNTKREQRGCLDDVA